MKKYKKGRVEKVDKVVEEKIDEKWRRVKKEKEKRKYNKKSSKVNLVDKETNIALSLAAYIVNFEALLAAYFNDGDDFTQLYSEFREENKVDDLVGKVVDYDEMYEILGGGGAAWLEMKRET
jgi:hypothetical protein